MDPTINLLPGLLPSGVRTDEFQAVLTHHFGGSFYNTDTLACLYPMRPPYALRLTFNQNMDLTGAYP